MRWVSSRFRRALLALLIVTGAGAVASGLLLARGGHDDAPSAGSVPAANRSEAPELDGDVLVPPPVRLAALRGTPVVVNFWASWCVPCRKEAPQLRRFSEERPQGAQLVGVNFQDAKSDALSFVREFGWAFPNVRDAHGALAARYGLIGLPTTFVIDAQGRIAAQLTGEQTFDSLRRTVEEVE